ncbi:MAG: hypothetical protein EWV55_12690 [Microcystis viridis Mv_BB_P_19951000_S69]|uniref:Uncharacterized protein n=1 Tax=Microcystis viridis Mv_BB_P_19951000_S68D TaxID=2486270 RepID=A0A552H9B9_MICVR|nr:MAG: hypothetical protein EWV77_21695 [Microcystis viridis Mv_BB_P_19951000_S68D]TRU73665.1 MAG: hypothetical protein EWV55_12690 [Microcystis viridis Mv_BB_P_19951000_S69]TRU77607.1 MAG: hypothetical protein EWV47_03855 [Microcystis viridis Mv_BB_P_19951000_S68]TRU81428.1 MAG: hypothetical protein EWV46_20970 [Microcystis viridis Mv_BB_P_19951000_S69D]
MQKKSIISPAFVKGILIIITTYFFLANLPIIDWLNIGLDYSWAFAISDAAHKQLIFGKDIIFTYGPLGYLVHGTSLNHNFSQIIYFRWLIHLCLLTVVILRLSFIKSYSNQIVFVLSIIFATLVGNPYNSIGFTVDYQIIFILLILMSFDNFFQKYINYLAIAIGIISGFSILTKLTLGIYLAGSLFIYIFVNIVRGYFQKSPSIVIKNVLAGINLTLTIPSIAFIFLYPAASNRAFIHIIVNLCIAGGVALTLWFIVKKTSLFRHRFQGNYLFLYNLLPLLVFYGLYGLLLLQTINLDNFPSLLGYLSNSWQISSGYSSGMSIVGNYPRLLIALLCFALSLFLMSLAIIDQKISLAIAYIFPIFLSFKHGFVRQDDHVVVFTLVVIVLASLYTIIIKNPRFKKIAYCAWGMIFFGCIIITSSPNWTILENARQWSNFSPDRVVNNIGVVISSMLNPTELKMRGERSTTQNLQVIATATKIPDSVLEKVQGKTIDIIPWEFSLIPGNQLNWKPRPIIQSYSAYTEKLDELNYQSLSQSPRDYLIYHFQSIDGRHPFFDEPKAFSYVVCNYQLDSVNSPFQVPAIKTNFYLLEKQKVSRCIPTPLGETTNITWDQVYELPTRNRGITRAQVKFEYSWLGKIVKQLFRIPPVIINVNYLDGTQVNFRFVQDNSANGVILSHLPRNDQELMAFFQGKLPPQVKSFSFSVSNPLLFSPEIKVTPFGEVETGS